MFDALVDEFRNHSTEWLEGRRRDLIDEQRRLHSEELAIIRVLDERGRIDARLGDHGESPQTVRQKLETARRLESLPNIGAAACEGQLSDEQLDEVVQLADEESDAYWAGRAPHAAPRELSRMVRNAKKPSTEDSLARHEARSLTMRWDRSKTMLQLHGLLPDVMGAQFEKTINDLMEAQRPRKGEAWDTFQHRAADALVSLCESGGDGIAGNDGDAHTPKMATRPVAQIHIPLTGPAEFAGVPIADSLLEQWRANVSVEPVIVDDSGVPLGFGTRTTFLSPKIIRAVLLRDHHCRICGSTRGLQVHHLRPRTWGGTDDISGLALVCCVCHRPLIPHGPWALVGNPNVPDGLRRVHLDDLTPEEAEQVGRPPPRPG
jgi:hypothetical protein